MVTHYAKPNRVVTTTHTATDYDIEAYVTKIDVWRRENAIDTAQVTIADSSRAVWGVQVDRGDRIRIYLNYKEVEDPPTLLVFDGYIDDASPVLDTGGELAVFTARQVGRSLLQCVVKEEYGGESHHDDIDTLKEIITDAVDGVVPNWVNKIPWSTNTTSGYSLGLDSGGTDYVADIAGTVNYLYFPCKPANECLNDLMDVLQAIKGAAAGPHWIVHPTNFLCVATVGNHEAGPLDLWPTWWNTDQAGSTLVENTDFNSYKFDKRASNQNYVLYHGNMRKPTGEAWTEEGDASSNGSALWSSEGASHVLSDDNAVFKVGLTSVKVAINDEPVVKYVQVPNAQQSWEVDKWGGEYNRPRLRFWARFDGNATAFSVQIHTNGGAVDYWEYDVFAAFGGMNTGVWRYFDLPIGPYWDEETDETFTGWTIGAGAPVWTDVEYLRFSSACQALNTGNIWIDGLHFSAWIIRGVRQVAAYSVATPVKIKLITDNVAKDDSGLASDDSGIIARLAYAEWLRSKSTPTQGIVVIPAKPAILAGQLTHIHAGNTTGATYRINSDMRIVEHHLSLSPSAFLSYLTLTDDVTNGRAMPPRTAYNLLLEATNPDFQNRQIASIKTRDIDITQTIMEKTY